MKLKYLIGAVAVAMILVACSKPKQEPAETADKATTEQVAKEAEQAAQTEPKADSAEPAKADEAKAEPQADAKAEDKADAKADDKPDEAKETDKPAEGGQKAEDRVPEDQKY